MDRGRRAEPYSNATIWTREIARNLAGHLSRVSKAHSCVDTKSPKSTRLPKFHHSYALRPCLISSVNTRQPFVLITRSSHGSAEQEGNHGGQSGCNEREETDFPSLSNENDEIEPVQRRNARQERMSKRSNETCRATAELDVDQKSTDRSVRIPAVKVPAKQHGEKGRASDAGAYDAPLVLPQPKHRMAHDFYRKQEQRKIWHENQALYKRLQSTKATLNAKEWEKDGKWTQQFLKTQERRRSALQQELRRAQSSPQAVMRSKTLKSLHPPYLKDMCQHRGVEKGSESTFSKSLRSLSTRDNSDTTVQQTSATSHRRLWRQKLSSVSLVDAPGPSSTSTETAAVDSAASGDDAALTTDNGTDAVSFASSRERSHSNVKRSGRMDSLQIDQCARNATSLSGAYSPGIELESALIANDNQDKIDDETLHESSETLAEGKKDTADQLIECEETRPTSEEEHTVSEETYDDDDFDDDASPSKLMQNKGVDKAEMRTESKEDLDTGAHNNVSARYAPNNQEDSNEEEDEVSYSCEYEASD